jgi:hypothetical protein
MTNASTLLSPSFGRPCNLSAFGRLRATAGWTTAALILTAFPYLLFV